MKSPLGVKPRVLALLAGGVLSFGAGAVIASEFPAESTALVYSGRLTDSAGNPRTTIESVSVTLFSAANGGASLCAASQPAVDLGATQGRFSVPLPELCLDALAEAGDAWAEVKVGSTTLPRQKLGAVPFAVVARESQHASTADVASSAEVVGPNGVDRAAIRDGAVSAAKLDPPLSAAISEHGSRLGALESPLESSRRYVVATLAAQTPPGNVSTVLQLDGTTARSLTPDDMDLSNDRFVANVPGVYALTLQVAANQWHNSKPLISVTCGPATGHYSAAAGNSRNNGGAARGTWFFVLEVGDTCQARIVLSDLTTPVTLDTDPFRSFFEVLRVSP